MLWAPAEFHNEIFKKCSVPTSPKQRQWAAGMWPGLQDMQGCRITRQLGTGLSTPEIIQHLDKKDPKAGSMGLSEEDLL